MRHLRRGRFESNGSANRCRWRKAERADALAIRKDNQAIIAAVNGLTLGAGTESYLEPIFAWPQNTLPSDYRRPHWGLSLSVVLM